MTTAGKTIRTTYPFLQRPPDPTTPTVASDLEGTLSAGVTWRGMRDYLVAHGRKADFQRYLRRNLRRILLYRLGLGNIQTFKEDWVAGILALFAGASPSEFEAMAAWVIDRELWPQRRQAVIQELQAHTAAGRRVILISGMFEPMLGQLARRLGFEAIGTPLLFDRSGIFSGRLAESFNTGERKVERLRPFLASAGPNAKLYAAYGDTASDVPMLRLSHYPVAVAPTRPLRQVAEAHNWRIIAV